MRKLGRTQTIRNPPTSVVWPNRLPDLSHFDGYVIDEEVCEVLTQLGNNGVRIYHQALRATGVGMRGEVQSYFGNQGVSVYCPRSARGESCVAYRKARPRRRRLISIWAATFVQLCHFMAYLSPKGPINCYECGIALWNSAACAKQFIRSSIFRGTTLSARNALEGKRGGADYS